MLEFWLVFKLELTWQRRVQEALKYHRRFAHMSCQPHPFRFSKPSIMDVYFGSDMFAASALVGQTVSLIDAIKSYKQITDENPAE